MTRHEFKCALCDESKVHESSLTTGNGIDTDGRKLCFECCGKRDRRTMIEVGHSRNLPLYLCGEKGKAEVTNWPGTLRFPVYFQRASRHNLARVRHDVWFVGPDRHVWHGVQYGNWSQVCHAVERTRFRKPQLKARQAQVTTKLSCTFTDITPQEPIMAIRRMTKEEKRIEVAVEAAFRKVGSNRQFKIFDLAKISNAGNVAAKAGQDIEAAVAKACDQFEIKEPDLT